MQHYSLIIPEIKGITLFVLFFYPTAGITQRLYNWSMIQTAQHTVIC